VEVGLEETKTGKKSKYILHGERKTVQVESPRGNKVASIDLGINVLASAVINDGTWLLYKGVRAKEDYFYFERKIAGVQSLADETKNSSEREAYEELNGEERRLFKKLTRRLLHLYTNFAFTYWDSFTNWGFQQSTWATHLTSLRTRATSSR